MTATEAAVLVAAERFEVQEFPLPEVGPDTGLLEIESSGICGSDLEPYLHGSARLGGGRVIRPPVILGHEMVGRIAKVGREAAQRWNLAEGDRVILERWMPCGRCAACRSGRFASCYRLIDGEPLFYGGTPTSVTPGLWGGFARHMYLHPDSLVHRVPDATPASVNSMFTPLGNAISWILNTGRLGLGETLLIEGPGPIGLLCAMLARRAGAGCVIVSGLAKDRRRLDLALELGATHVLDASVEDVAQRCRDIAGHGGVDLVLDATSTSSLAPVAAAVDAARPSGRVVLASGHSSSGATAEILARVQDKELTMTGVRGRDRRAAGQALEFVTDPGWADSLQRLCDPVVSLHELDRGFKAVLSGEALHASMAPSI
jgi:threonine dehydrogenase-like Zn-dependent dehydrogenase